MDYRNHMNVLNNFLTSGHQFSEDENLLKFRFSFLNSLMVTASFFTLLNFLASIFGAIEAPRSFEIALLVYFIVSIFVIYSLRKDKSYYVYVVYYFLITSLVLFYFVFFTKTEDEFRLIAFYFALFATFVLLGKKYGVGVALFIMASILIISMNYDLELSSIVYGSFYNFFVMFTIFLYFFLNKVERDSIEFKTLNIKLKENVKKEKQQRKDQELMLLRQSRMANMGEMLDSIAHQWRQPLMHINSILMNIDLALEAKQKDPEYLTKKTDEVATLTSHMSQTIEDFRDLFKLEEEQQQFALESVINDVLALMKNRFNNISIDYKAAGDSLIYGYKSELIQVIIILLSNAVDAFEKQTIKNKKIIINTNISKDNCVLTIEDNAGGITSDNIEAIFAPYYTTKEKSGGTGLGLHIARIIVEHKMGGTITASNTSKGAQFSISLIKCSK